MPKKITKKFKGVSLFKKVDIKKEVVNKTIKCRKKKACLYDASRLCAVKSAINKNVIFVKKLSGKPCEYYQPFGSDGCCRCPVRIEIYRKYGK